MNSKIKPCLRRVMTGTRNLAYKKCNRPEAIAKWDLIVQGMAESALKVPRLYPLRHGIMYCNVPKAGYQLTQETTVYAMCAGGAGVTGTCLVARLCTCVSVYVQEAQLE